MSLVAREVITSEEPIDAAEQYPKKNKNKKQERKQTQYLRRFDNLTTSSGQGREIIDSTTNTICTLHII